MMALQKDTIVGYNTLKYSRFTIFRKVATLVLKPDPLLKTTSQGRKGSISRQKQLHGRKHKSAVSSSFSTNNNIANMPNFLDIHWLDIFYSFIDDFTEDEYQEYLCNPNKEEPEPCFSNKKRSMKMVLDDTILSFPVKRRQLVGM